MIRAKAKKVTGVKSEKAQKVIQDLIDSMRHHELIGMAAPQIGSNLRIFITEIRKTRSRSGNEIKKDPLKIYVNPRIVWRSEK